MDFKAFNEWKNKAFQTNTEQEYKQWQEDFRTWYNSNEWNEWEKNLIKEQLTKLNEQKENFFNKQKQHPQIIKNNFILRPEEGVAFTRLCNALADLISKQAQFGVSRTPTIASNGEGGQLSQGSEETLSEGAKNNASKINE